MLVSFNIVTFGIYTIAVFLLGFIASAILGAGKRAD